MRHLLAAVLLAAPGLAADPVKPADVVELAIKAHGGKEALAKAAKGSQKMTGTLTVLGTEMDFAGEVLYALPDKYKMTLTISQPGQKVVVSQVVNGDKVRTLVDGKSRPLTAAQTGELRQSAANQEISLLVALLDEKKYKLKAGTDAKVGELDAAAVVVSGADKETKLDEVTLLFDKKTGQLARMTRTAAGPDDKPATEETTFAEFKKFGEALLPTKLTVTRGGKKFMTATVAEMKWLDKIDDKTFAVDE